MPFNDSTINWDSHVPAFGPSAQIPTSSDISSMIPDVGFNYSTYGFNPLSSLFPNDKGLASNPFLQQIEGLNPQEQMLGQSLFDMFTLSSRGGGGSDYLGNLLRNSYKSGGSVKAYREGGQTELVPIQAEKYKGMKEQIVSPNMDIFDTKATKSHEKMKDEDITDILPEGMYVGSARKNYSISKKEAEDITFGFPAVEYKEGMNIPMPKEILFSDVFTKNKHTSAELFKNIKRKFPVLDREDDPLTDAANSENKFSRAPFVQATIGIVEDKKPVEKKSDGGGVFMNSDAALTGLFDMGLLPNLLPQSFKAPQPDIFKYGGKSKRKPKKYIDPLTISAIAGLGSSLFGFLGNNNARNQTNRLTAQTLSDIQGFEDTALGNLQAGSATQLAATLGQDNDYTYLDNSLSRAIGNEGYARALRNLNNEQDRTGNRLQGSVNNVARNLFANTSNFSLGVSAANSLLPNLLRAQSDNAASFANQRTNVFQNQAQFNSGKASEIERDSQAGGNFERTQRNTQLAQIGDIGSNYFNNQNQVLGNTLNSRMAARGQQAVANQQFATNNSQLVNNALGSAALLFSNNQQQGRTSQTFQDNLFGSTSVLPSPGNSANCFPDPITGQLVNRLTGQPC